MFNNFQNPQVADLLDLFYGRVQFRVSVALQSRGQSAQNGIEGIFFCANDERETVLVSIPIIK